MRPIACHIIVAGMKTVLLVPHSSSLSVAKQGKGQAGLQCLYCDDRQTLCFPCHSATGKAPSHDSFIVLHGLMRCLETSACGLALLCRLSSTLGFLVSGS